MSSETVGRVLSALFPEAVPAWIPGSIGLYVDNVRVRDRVPIRFRFCRSGDSVEVVIDRRVAWKPGIGRGHAEIILGDVGGLAFLVIKVGTISYRNGIEVSRNLGVRANA